MPGAAAPLVVWLLAFSLAAVWNVVYAVFLLSRNNTWARYAWMGWAELFRKFRNVRAGGGVELSARERPWEFSGGLYRAPRPLYALVVFVHQFVS